MMNKIAFAIPLLIAVAGIVTIPNAFAQTTTTTTTTPTPDHFHFHHFFRGGFGFGAGAVIVNPVTSNVVCANPAAPVPVQTSTGTFCLSTANAGSDVIAGSIVTPAAPVVIAGTTFGGFGFHHFHFHH